MEQQGNGTPASVAQVIYVSKTKKTTKETYAARTVAALGCVQILCGLIALGLEIFILTLPRNYSIASGVWCSVIFLVSGILSLFSARFKNLCLVITTMVLCILSSVCAGILLILSITWLLINSCGSNSTECIVSYSVIAFMGVVMGVISIVISALTCRATCCRPDSTEGRVYCTGEHVSIQIPPLTDTNNSIQIPALADMNKQDGEEKKIDGANKEGHGFTYQRL